MDTRLVEMCENLAQVELLLCYGDLDEAVRQDLSYAKVGMLERIAEASKSRVRGLTKSN